MCDEQPKGPGLPCAHPIEGGLAFPRWFSAHMSSLLVPLTIVWGTLMRIKFPQRIKSKVPRAGEVAHIVGSHSGDQKSTGEEPVTVPRGSLSPRAPLPRILRSALIVSFSWKDRPINPPRAGAPPVCLLLAQDMPCRS